MITYRKIIEKGDLYVLPIENRKVSRCYVDYAFGIEFFEEGPETTIRIGGFFLLLEKSQEHKLMADDPASLGPAFGLFGRIVVSANAFKNGKLEIVFDNGTLLRVSADPKYEPWEIVGSDGLKIVSMPGGKLAIWQGF